MSCRVVAIYPGTFDPFTLGHEDIVHRSVQLFGHLTVAVAAGHHKKTMFSLQERMEMAHDAFLDDPRVKVASVAGLMRDFVLTCGATVMVRGVRAMSDFDYEYQLAGMNRCLMPQVETVFLTPSDPYQYISSTFVREIVLLGGDVTQLVSVGVHDRIKQKLSAWG